MVVLLLVIGIAVGGVSSSDGAYAEDHAVEPGQTTDSENTSSIVSLEVSGDPNGVVETGVGVTAYRVHDVSVKVTDVLEYYLKIAGASELKAPSGETDVPSLSVPTQGKDIPEDNWGYAWAWDKDTVTDEAEMTYVGMSATETELARPSLSDGNASFTGKLSFAAKFKQNAVLGSYGSGVILTLIATPKSNVVSNRAYWYKPDGDEMIETAYYSDTNIMQKVTPDFCRGNDQIGTGWTITLVDDRDGSEYKVVKLPDGNCWMQENLRLQYNETNINKNVLTSEDTDLPVGTVWNLPENATSWDTSDNTKAQIAVGNAEMAGWKEGYGNYYSWAAATAETGNTVTADGAVAAGSICPKGWTLPTGGSGGAVSDAIWKGRR